MTTDAAPEKKIKLEDNAVYILKGSHPSGCGLYPHCHCIDLVRDEIEQEWEIPENSSRVTHVLASIVSSLPGWRLWITEPDYDDNGGLVEYRVVRIEASRKAAAEFMNLLVYENRNLDFTPKDIHLLEEGWMPLASQTSQEPIRVDRGEQFEQWVAKNRTTAKQVQELYCSSGTWNPKRK